MGTVAENRVQLKPGIEVQHCAVTPVGDNLFTLGGNVNAQRSFEPHHVVIGNQRLTLWVEQRERVGVDERVPAIVRMFNVCGEPTDQFRAVTLSSNCYAMVSRDPEHVTQRVYYNLGIEI